MIGAALSLPVLAALVGGLVGVSAALRLAGALPERESTIQRPGLSGLLRVRTGVLLGVVAIVGVVLLVVGLMVGDFPISVSGVINALLGDPESSQADFMVNSLRFPRVLVALLAGGCLAMSGALFQSLIDNPLVSPDVIGINNGAAICAVFILVATDDLSVLPFAAFVGAVVTALLIYLLTWRNGVSASRLVLVGIGVNAFLSAGLIFLQVRFPVDRVIAAARWQAGTLFGSDWADVRLLAASLAVLVPVGFVLVRRLRILQLGDDVAAGLGIATERDRLAIIVVASALAAIAVSVVGPLAFVALLIPHMTRLLAGPITGGSLVLTGCVGGVFLLAADLVAQRLFAPTIIPAGIVTAAVGGPYFLYLLSRFNRAI